MNDRVIKFRAWDGKKYTDDNCVIIYCDGSTAVFDRWGDVVQEKLTIQQFTGLYDKYGKEIYEGDIIKCCDPDDQATAVVVMGKFGWMKQYGDETSQYPLTDFDLHWFEVVGNIYETPELLEQKK